MERRADRTDDLETQIEAAKALLSFLEGLRERDRPPAPAQVGDKMRRLLLSPLWPAAIDRGALCDPNSDVDKIRRGRWAIDNLVDRTVTYRDAVLDFGCGEGHAAWAARDGDPHTVVGYDPRDQGWCRYPRHDRFLLTDDWDDVRGRGPYDLVLAHDVLDHAAAPVECLEKIKEVLSTGGRSYVRCHPWVARHGGHGYRGLNKAYCHLVFAAEELRSWGWDGGAAPQRVTEPLGTYRGWFAAAALRVVSERPQASPVEPLFTGIPAIARRLVGYGEAIRVQFVDYVLSGE